MRTHLKIFLLSIFFFLNSVVAQPIPRLSSKTEWRALLELRASLGIKAKDWHKKANPCLNWTGIECGNGRVIGINLSGLRRTRQGRLNPRFAVDSLPNFPLLSTFNSSRFLLRGSIPEWFGHRLSNIEVLDLRSSSIHGSIPASLGNLSKLSSLHLSSNSITGSMPTSLGKLFSLSVLDLSQNLLTGWIPNEISALGNLSTLDLSSNYFSGSIPPGFGSLSSLKTLNLSNNSLSDFIPTQLGYLSQLMELDLGFNSLSGTLPENPRGLRSLRKLSVRNNELKGSLSGGLFKKLDRLEYLALNRNHLVGNISDVLRSMSYLKYLDVSGNNLTGVFPNLTAFSVPGSVFNFSNNQFYGYLNSGFGKLQIIDVSNNYFEGSAPNYTGISIMVSHNCFRSVPGQRNFKACLKFYSDRGMHYGNNTGHKPQNPTLTQQHKSRKTLTYVMIGVFGGLGFIMALISGVALLLKLCNVRGTDNQRENRSVTPVVEGGIGQPPKAVVEFSGLGEAFTYEQLLLATCNFSSENLIKHGHSGDLFSGKLEGGHDVVVKRIYLNSIRNGSFMLELDFFGKVSHPRLVPLLGHCLEGDHEKFLVYKYMPNGDLSNALYRSKNPEEQLQSLDWITRSKIAIGAAEALSYLHHECTPLVIHRDIQASSILLDDKYEVRLGSFSEVCSPAEDNQNMFARFLHTPRTSDGRPSGSSSITCAYDVYSFGKVLLELVTGTLGISRLNDAEAKQWLESNLPFISIHDKEQVIKIVDQSLIIDEDLLEEIWAVAIVAKSCLNPKASRRPLMKHVLKALENPFKVVREENFNSDKLRTASSSRLTLAAALFGSWHRSSSDSSNRSGQTNKEIMGGLRQTERLGSRSSGANDHSSSHKRSSSDVFPEPVEIQDVERQDWTTS